MNQIKTKSWDSDDESGPIETSPKKQISKKQTSKKETSPKKQTSPKKEISKKQISKKQTSTNKDSDTQYDKRRELLRVDTDPRTVGFTYGPKHANVRDIAMELNEKYGETVFIQYMNPPNFEFGFWKVLSNSTEACKEVEEWLRKKESECQKEIILGNYRQHIHPPRKNR